MDEIKYKPIGIIHSPFEKTEGTPIQVEGARGIEGKIEVFREYVDGLKDLDGFSHIILIYHFHLVKGAKLMAKPFMNNKEHGIFAIRAPVRPNPIGFSVVHLLTIEDNILYIKDVDIVDGTPLLDIKPFVPEFDIRKVEKIGWLDKKVKRLPSSKDNGRFTSNKF